MEKTINERIRYFLKNRGITINNLAEQLGCSQSTLSNKLGGRYRVDIDTIISLLTLYDKLSADWLLLGRGPMFRTQEYNFDPVRYQVNDDGDNISGYGNTVHKDNSRVVELLEKQLEEEKARSREYWETIQQLIKK